VADFRDINGIRFGLRASRDHHMDKDFMARFVCHVDKFVMACGIQQPSAQHPRGAFAQAIFGYNHGMGEGNNVGQLVFFKARTLKISRSHIVSVSTLGIRKQLTTCCAVQRCAW
jgi:hypothetical protein